MPVFVPWEDYGICKWHMLQRCHAGDECAWRHPSAQERSWLWDSHKAKQERDWELYGIPPPQNPFKNKGASTKRPTPLPTQAARTRTVSPSALDAPASPSPERNDDDVNVATSSTDNMPSRIGPKNSNKMPLGRPNRLQTLNEDNGTNKRLDAGNAGLHRDGKNGEGLSNGLSTLDSGMPSNDAVTVWKRVENMDNDTPMTDRQEQTPKIGGYWERKKMRDALLKQQEEGAGVKVESMPPPPAPAGEAKTKDPSTSTSSRPPSQLKPRYGAPYADKDMGGTKRMSNGEVKPVGPHPSTIKVSAPYLSQAKIEKQLQPSPANGQFEVQERSNAEAREDSMRLQGVTWIDNVRRALSLPIRTYSTACIYYHKFRLANPGVLHGMEYSNAWADACAASLLMACKNEDTLKKSKDILAAAYNLKTTGHDQLGSDDPVFEQQSKAVIGLERMVLEAGGFDFRSKHPHKLFAKIARAMPEGQNDERARVEKVGWMVMTDMYRTFAPLKQTTATMALADLELAAHLVATSSSDNNSAIRDELLRYDLSKWSTSREQVMETLLDLLDLYTQHTAHTILGTQYSLDDFLRIRLAFNKECNENNLPRYTLSTSSDRQANGTTLQVANGHPTPVSPPQTEGQQQTPNLNQPPLPEGGGTLRFMLNPQLASDEKTEVQKYFVEEWEEYEEEIEIPLPRAQSRDRDSRRGSLDRGPESVRGERVLSDRDRERERLRERERELERDRARIRDRDRDRRYDDRRFEDRRFEDRRRFDDRRFDDRRRRG